MTSKTNYYDPDICVRYHPSYWYHKIFEWTINRRTILTLVNFVTTSPRLPYNSNDVNTRYHWSVVGDIGLQYQGPGYYYYEVPGAIYRLGRPKSKRQQQAMLRLTLLQLQLQLYKVVMFTADALLVISLTYENSSHNLFSVDWCSLSLHRKAFFCRRSASVSVHWSGANQDGA